MTIYLGGGCRSLGCTSVALLRSGLRLEASRPSRQKDSAPLWTPFDRANGATGVARPAGHCSTEAVEMLVPYWFKLRKIVIGALAEVKRVPRRSVIRRLTFTRWRLRTSRLHSAGPGERLPRRAERPVSKFVTLPHVCDFVCSACVQDGGCDWQDVQFGSARIKPDAGCRVNHEITEPISYNLEATIPAKAARAPKAMTEIVELTTI